MIVETRIINGQTVKVFSRDGKNFSTNPDELSTLEASMEKVESDSPFWDIPGKFRAEDAIEDAYEQF